MCHTNIYYIIIVDALMCTQHFNVVISRGSATFNNFDILLGCLIFKHCVIFH